MRDVAQFLKVLADEARLQMLWLLFNHRELCVCDIMETLGITQSKASRHLATLRHARLVVDRKAGAWSYYSLCPVETELERAQIELLRARLADHPVAARLLRDLQAWLERKERAAACAADGACASQSLPGGDR
ncbi:MAG: metalloregulator ArsR/SmtB family transcription factor [Deltaproteobacteria bacterium]|nr:metalloregulator ArsR/SmtB family transcription factor [Deltaproteobacteria bacterium]